MSHIRILPEELVKKISAGEVIERPASVIKELLENSLDAKSGRISVEIRQGGKKLIKVKDDGIGMEPEDLKICTDRHTTSKIKELEDIYNINTLGFRGEALSSIAAVSKLEVTSCYKKSKNAYKLSVNGKNKEIIVAKASSGTLICVNELFYNVPARLKFLKSVETETGYINDIIHILAIYNYAVCFELKSDGRELLFVEQVKTMRERLYQLFGENTVKCLLPVKCEQSGVKIDGFISSPQELKSSRNYIYTFVNGRLISDKTINHAIVSGYGNLIPFGKYPLAVLDIKINPGLIDVNVHPTKKEVKFSNGALVHNAVESAIKESLISGKPVPAITLEGASQSGTIKNIGSYSGDNNNSRLESIPAAFENRASFVQEVLQDEKKYRLKPIYQAKSMYIIAADEEAVYIIDQHVAHEKVLYEKLKDKKQSCGSQQLLTSISVSLKYKQVKILNDNIKTFKTFGFDVEAIGKDTFMINGVPEFLAGKDSERVLIEVIEQLEEDNRNSSSISDKADLIVKTLACHSAVRAGDSLSYELMLILINNFIECDLPYCPHGRPGIIKITFDELDKKFKRT
ncbi:MAG: hypothetical protein A2452_11930 [Candidatus Firestonebacteria bacterium RIFOXYC2_FULL_39_67]|nr:MAG: hypothetical protein A2536_07380 [Candidatus Firestonebacteria bacterium RIFOXYD2_FULL_39_29]OGF53927.1 MAG: hypothetical protein A2452_11930 [Candidatus Firestonebacteria bacterium RIFOXYC2_FULL_39_67]